MPTQQCRYEYNYDYEQDVQVCEDVYTQEEIDASNALAAQQAASVAPPPAASDAICAAQGKNYVYYPAEGMYDDGRYEETRAAYGECVDRPGRSCEDDGKVTVYQYGDSYVDSYDQTIEGGIIGSYCECPTYGCIGENQPLPSPASGCAAPVCCEGLTNQGGTCKPPAGTITGTYTTTYMASGPGVSFTVKETCNQKSTCDDGYQDVGTYNSVCYERKQTISKPRISAAGKVCAEPNPASKCPTNIGRVASGKYTSATGGAAQGIDNVSGVRLQCTYSTVTNPFDQQATSAFTGPGASDLATIKDAWCSPKTYADMANGPCVGFYTSRGDYDLQQVIRIQSENPTGGWVNNSQYLAIVQQVATGGTTNVAKQSAQGMIAAYCMTQNPSGWADNTTIRAIINSWALQNAANIGNDCQLLATGIVSQFCRTNPTSSSSHCDCYNATQFGTNIFTACQGNTTGACTDINNLAKSFAVAPPLFAPQIATLKSYITPNCAVGACVSAATSATSTYLPPSPLTQLRCDSSISLCLQSVKVGGSVAPGATINQNCSTTIGIGGTVPSANAPSTNQGFQNAQAVQANANAPGGGTLAVVSSPGASSTQVATTGTPGGGLQQTVTSNTPVGIGSSGGPVSYTSPAPATAPTPASVSVPIDDTQRRYVLAAGGGLLGLLCSCLFIVFCFIIGIMIFGGGNKPAAPRVVPLTAYGL
jgi:hypothetical protein